MRYAGRIRTSPIANRTSGCRPGRLRPQGREIFPRLTVEENLLMGLSRFPAREAQQVPEEIYQLSRCSGP
nr:urea ABC transporter, ATP-binding protein UrtE [Klebsiella pneumoniae]